MRISKKAGLITEMLGSEEVIFDTITKNVITLNESSKAVWSQIDNNCIEIIIENISKEYSIDSDQIREDILETIKIFEEANIISVDSEI